MCNNPRCLICKSSDLKQRGTCEAAVLRLLQRWDCAKAHAAPVSTRLRGRHLRARVRDGGGRRQGGAAAGREAGAVHAVGHGQRRPPVELEQDLSWSDPEQLLCCVLTVKMRTESLVAEFGMHLSFSALKSGPSALLLCHLAKQPRHAWLRCPPRGILSLENKSKHSH